MRTLPDHPGLLQCDGDMGNEWHYTQNGQPAPEPITTAQLRQLAAAGLLKPDDLVWQEGLTNWVPAGSIKGLFPAGKPAAEPPAPDKSSPNAVRAARGSRAATRTGTAIPTLESAPPSGSDLNPVLVFFLTVLTAGLFGLWYGLRVSGQYSARVGGRLTDSAGRPLGKVRHPAAVLLLGLVTFGFYFPYWIYRALADCCAFADRRDVHPRTELCLMLICPLYGVYLVVHRLPELIRQSQVLAGVVEPGPLERAPLFLDPCLFCALPLLCMIEQDCLNRVWSGAP
jgi:hypothetical protein